MTPDLSRLRSSFSLSSFARAASLVALLAAAPGLARAESAAPKPEAAKSDAAKSDAAKSETAKPVSDATVLATVNGEAITEKDLRIAADDLGPSLPQQLQGKARDAYLLDFLIDGALVAQKAKAEGLDKTQDFADRLAYQHEKLLMETMLGQVTRAAVTEAAIKKTYDEAIKAQKPEEEVHARHILVPTEEEAKAVLKRLKGGEDFAKVAKEVSKDPGAEGGDLGWFSKDKMVPEFADAAFKLQKPGDLSEPVKSSFGWHVIKLEGKREKPLPTLDEVRDQVSRYVAQKAQSDLVVGLRKDAKIERAPGAPTVPAPAAEPNDDKAPEAEKK
ncbi:peptidylprolyl isomerase [Methylocella sp.]|uniref:peptidylprolyl isomerase n=1 Tax=Methylocella sp. TaxID=1978226 RepID=UPI003783C149